jgi:hypothetical protein
MANNKNGRMDILIILTIIVLFYLINNRSPQQERTIFVTQPRRPRRWFYPGPIRGPQGPQGPPGPPGPPGPEPEPEPEPPAVETYLPRMFFGY